MSSLSSDKYIKFGDRIQACGIHDRGAFFLVSKRNFLYDKKECALAHSRAEARLLQQPSTLAPSAHPRRAFLSYGNEVSYTIKKTRLIDGSFLYTFYIQFSSLQPLLL